MLNETNPNPLDPTAQKDYSLEHNQLRPRSLRSNGIELDESCGDVTSVGLPGSVNLDELVAKGTKPPSSFSTINPGPPMMTPESKKLAERSAPQNALEDLTPSYNGKR